MTLSEEAVRQIALSIREHENPHNATAESRPAEALNLTARLAVLSEGERSGLDDAVDEVQIASKLWLINELIKCTDIAGRDMLVVGAWYGILPLLINWRHSLPPRRMLCIDIDATVLGAGERLIKPMYDNIEFLVADAMDFDYARFGIDGNSIVVNTVCEHLPEFTAWWESLPDGQFVALQSNDYFICPDHVNAVNSLDEMKAQAPMSEVFFADALPHLQWHRFMLIGMK